MNPAGLFWSLILAGLPLSVVAADSAIAVAERPARTPVQELVDAAGTGDTTTVRRLLDSGTLVFASVPDSGVQALHQAAANGHVTLVNLLLERGARVDAPDGEGASPLVYAAYHGRSSVVEVLLAAGASADLVPERQVHALNAAVMSGSVAAVKVLIEAGADPDLKDGFGKSARDYAIQHARADLTELFDATRERL